MKLNSVSIEIIEKLKKGRTREAPEFQFLSTLQRDLQSFGRNDVCLLRAGGVLSFLWSPKYNRSASDQLRDAVARARLVEYRADLEEYELSDHDRFSRAFSIDTEEIKPTFVECGDDQQLISLFEYYTRTQSIPSNVARGRFARFLVFDDGVTGRPLMAIIGLSSPIYFNGARDRLLGWGPVGRRQEGNWVSDPPAKAIRDTGLLCISHITIAAAVPPYDQLRIAKLISALCFSPEVIGFVERKYGQPIAGLTTTGGWGTNAAPYQRIGLGLHDDGQARELFKEMKPSSPSLNRSWEFFSDELLEQAHEIHRIRSEDSSEPLKAFREDETVRKELLAWALAHVGLPKKAVYVNQIGHFVGTRTDQAIRYLGNVQTGTVPDTRTIPVEEALSWWRTKTDRTVLRDVRPEKLSDRAA